MSRSLLAILLLALLAVAAITPKVYAQDAEADTDNADKQADDKQAYEEDDEEKSVLTPHADIDTVYYFKDITDKKIKLGQVTSLLANLHNKGASEFNITEIGASFHSPYDFQYHIQNFSSLNLPDGVALGASEEVSLEYMFRPDGEKLQPVEVWLYAWVKYNLSNEEYSSVIYNNTVTLVEEKSGLGSFSFFTYFLLLAAGGLGYYIFNSVKADAAKSSSSQKAKTETGTRAAEPTVQIYKPASTSKKVRRSPKKSK